MENRKLNILEIHFSRAWGGLEMQMPIVACGLKDIGHNVIVVCPEGSPTEKAAVQAGLKVINLENRIKYIDIFTIKKLKHIINENKIDVIYSHMAKDLWLIVPAGKMAGCKKIYFSRLMESHYKKRDILHYFLHRSLAGAIAISNSIKETLIYTTHIPPEKIETIYCGIDLKKFSPQSSSKNILRKEYGIPEDYTLIGIVGRLQEDKGQEFLLRAASIVYKKYPKIKIFIVGEETKGEEKGYINYLKEIAKELGIENNVIFTGFRNDVPAVMNSLDIVILASKREAFGIVVIEAMAMGKIVIATISLGTQEIIDDGIDGFLVSYENNEIMAERILEAILNQDKMNKMRIAARKKVEEKFEFNKNIKKIESLFLRDL